ncbi:MAG TPA: T9SS type A sorting domain-containing protein, partial [Phnomibacter sp.]|nr:T9SS type A sorting domain-containing protein [Phnomibacter sp.]
AIDHIRISAGISSPAQMPIAGPDPFDWRRLYPNPTSGVVSLEVYVPEATLAHVSLLDATGRANDMGPLSLDKGMNALRIDLPTRQPGMYLLRIMENGRSHVRTILLMK